MIETVIRTEDLSKFYGARRGVVDLDFEVRRGEVFGYLGPNGAGKTTTIRVLLDFLRPTSGRATVFGLDTRQESVAIRQRTGYLPGGLALYHNLNGREFLSHLAHLRGGVDWQSVTVLAERLEANLAQPIRSLSHGNKQKLGLIQAFMHDPELVVLDEPSTGLDPLMQQEFYRLIGERRSAGRTIFLSSHILPEVERLCDRVGIIRQGRLVAVEEISVLKARAVRRLEIRFAQPVPEQAFADVPGVRDLEVADSVLHCSVVGSLDQLIKSVARFEVVDVVSHEPNLEEVFLNFYSGTASGAA